MLFSVFMPALRSVRRNVLRSFLTILGIAIGVSAVITMVTLGNGATQAIEKQTTSHGTYLLIVSPGRRQPGGGLGGGASGVPQFIEAEAAVIQSQSGGVAALSAQGRASVTGSSNEWFITGIWTLSSGRIFDHDERRAGAAVCIIGETAHRELYAGSVGQMGLGQHLRVKQFSCEVVGILKA